MDFWAVLLLVAVPVFIVDFYHRTIRDRERKCLERRIREYERLPYARNGVERIEIAGPRDVVEPMWPQARPRRPTCPPANAGEGTRQ